MHILHLGVLPDSEEGGEVKNFLIAYFFFNIVCQKFIYVQVIASRVRTFYDSVYNRKN